MLPPPRENVIGLPQPGAYLATTPASMIDWPTFRWLLELTIRNLYSGKATVLLNAADWNVSGCVPGLLAYNVR
jgi:hypothetical protein